LAGKQLKVVTVSVRYGKNRGEIEPDSHNMARKQQKALKNAAQFWRENS